MKEKQSKALYILYIDRSVSVYSICLLQWMQGNIYREVFPTFLAKKTYGSWITRRRMEIYTKISKEKYPKVSVTTIGKLQENTRALCKMAAKFSQQKVDFAALRSWLSA